MLTERLGRPFRIGVLFHAAYHGATPCDAEQRFVKSTNDNLGSSNKTFSEGIDKLVAMLSSQAMQPERTTSKTICRKVVVVPVVPNPTSIWKSLKDTKLHRFYWCDGVKHILKRRRYPCLYECCTIDRQSTECKFTDRFGEIEQVKLEYNPAKVLARRGRSSSRHAEKKQAEKSRASPPRRNISRQPGRRQGRSRKQYQCRLIVYFVQ